jgi:hypothetical protein
MQAVQTKKQKKKMKYLKTFENYSTDITEDIANDILPKLQQLKDEKGSFTVEDFENYMKQRGSDLETIDLVMSNLVNLGFDFDMEDEEDVPLDFELKDTFY